MIQVAWYSQQERCNKCRLIARSRPRAASARPVKAARDPGLRIVLSWDLRRGRRTSKAIFPQAVFARSTKHQSDQD